MKFDVGYASEKVGAAIRIMMLAPDRARAIAAAMHEYNLGMKIVAKREGMPRDLEDFAKTIDRIMESDGSWEDRARELNEIELHDLELAFWELDRALSRLYYGERSGR